MNTHHHSHSSSEQQNTPHGSWNISDEEFQTLVADSLAGQLDASAQAGFEAMLALNADRKREFDELAKLWSRFGTLPTEMPSAALVENFSLMLRAYQQGLQEARAQKKVPLIERVNASLEKFFDRIVPSQPIWQLNLALAVIAISFGAGWMFLHVSWTVASWDVATNAQRIANGFGHHTDEMTQLRSEVRSMSRLLALSLVKQESASERLRGVSLSASLVQGKTNPDEEVVSTLLATLKHDANVNVRLAAAEALAGFRNRADVRSEIIAALVHEESPLVQVTLVELLSAGNGSQRDAQTDEAFRKLLQDSMLNAAVRSKIQQTLQTAM